MAIHKCRAPQNGAAAHHFESHSFKHESSPVPPCYTTRECGLITSPYGMQNLFTVMAAQKGGWRQPVAAGPGQSTISVLRKLLAVVPPIKALSSPLVPLAPSLSSLLYALDSHGIARPTANGSACSIGRYGSATKPGRGALWEPHANFGKSPLLNSQLTNLMKHRFTG